MSDFAKDFMKILSEYKDLVTEDLDFATKETAQEAVKELKATSPKKTGRYAKGWTSKKTTSNSHQTAYTVYNKDAYQLTHLLEHGHASVRGGRTYGRVEPKVHIEPVEQKAIESLEKKLKQKLEEKK